MTLRVGLIGTGTVGSGFVEIVESRKKNWQDSYGVQVEIAGIAACSMEELAPYASRGFSVTTSADELVKNPEIDLIVELAGGYDLPKKWISAALEAGKHVVTANKALVAKHGSELLPLAGKKGLQFLFEAAVGGGIPIIRTLQISMAGNRVDSLRCIINGTCNYILTEMLQKGSSFAEVLDDAQVKGYAEADPTFDVDGIDSAHKLAILATICSGRLVDFEKMQVEGIREIEAIDIRTIDSLGGCIKLLGVFRQSALGIEARVYPAILGKEHLLAGIHGVTNAVYLESDNLGPHLQTGAGAGKLPTASAVAADVLAIAREACVQGIPPLPSTAFLRQGEVGLLDPETLESRFYIRMEVKDEPGVLAAITGIFSQGEISIESIHQTPAQGSEKASITAITHCSAEGKVLAALKEITALDAVSGLPQRIRYAD